MTSSQYDPREGFDDTIGGDAREKDTPADPLREAAVESTFASLVGYVEGFLGALAMQGETRAQDALDRFHDHYEPRMRTTLATKPAPLVTDSQRDSLLGIARDLATHCGLPDMADRIERALATKPDPLREALTDEDLANKYVPQRSVEQIKNAIRRGDYLYSAKDVADAIRAALATAEPKYTRDFGDFATENVMGWIDDQLERCDAPLVGSGMVADQDVGDALRWLRANLYGIRATKPAEANLFDLRTYDEDHPTERSDEEFARQIKEMDHPTESAGPAKYWKFGNGRYPAYETILTVEAQHYPEAWDKAQEELDRRNPKSPGGWVLDLLWAGAVQPPAPDQEGWIPVSERLPGPGDTFVVHTRANGDVTHWKPVHPTESAGKSPEAVGDDARDALGSAFGGIERATMETERVAVQPPSKPIWEELAEIGASVPPEAWASVQPPAPEPLTEAQRDKCESALEIADALATYCRHIPRSYLMQQAEDCIRALHAAYLASPPIAQRGAVQPPYVPAWPQKRDLAASIRVSQQQYEIDVMWNNAIDLCRAAALAAPPAAPGASA